MATPTAPTRRRNAHGKRGQQNLAEGVHGQAGLDRTGIDRPTTTMSEMRQRLKAPNATRIASAIARRELLHAGRDEIVVTGTRWMRCWMRSKGANPEPGVQQCVPSASQSDPLFISEFPVPFVAADQQTSSEQGRHSLI